MIVTNELIWTDLMRLISFLTVLFTIFFIVDGDFLSYFFTDPNEIHDKDKTIFTSNKLSDHSHC